MNFKLCFEQFISQDQSIDSLSIFHDQDAEERRLFYVGMTRAQDQLILSHSLRRHWQGKIQQHKISRFFLEIEQALVKSSHSQPHTNRTKSKQLNLW